MDHFQIPKTTYNADVETVHNLIELEFFDIETFRDRGDFFLKASTWQRWFNILRKNGHKWDKSPLDIIREAAPQAGEAVATLPVLDLDDLVSRKIAHLIKSSHPHQGGYHVPGQTRIRPKGLNHPGAGGRQGEFLGLDDEPAFGSVPDVKNSAGFL